MEELDDYFVHVDRLILRVNNISKKLIERNNNYRFILQDLSNAYQFEPRVVDTINHKMDLIMNCYQEMIEVLQELGDAQVKIAKSVVEDSINLRKKVDDFTKYNIR